MQGAQPKRVSWLHGLPRQVSPRRWMRLNTFFLLSDLLRQTVNNLWHDDSLFKFSTWRSAWVFLFTKQGLFRSSYAMWRRYFRPDFHPQQDDDSLSRQWFQANAQQFHALGRTAA